MNGYKGNDQLLRQQSSTKAHEAQLLDARRQRKETDDQLQAMMNRIAFLAQEELRLDRDIEAARRRAAEALARQATRDQEIAATAKDVLAVMPAAAPQKPTRPHTGRSSLLATLSDGASTSAPASGATSLRASSSASLQSSSRSLDSGGPAPSLSPASPPTGLTGGLPGSGGPSGGGGGGGGSGSGPGPGPGPGSGHPPRAPSASRGRPPVLAGRAADKASKLPPVAPTTGIRSPSPGGAGTGAPGRPSSASRPSTAGGRSRASSTSPTTSVSGSSSARRLSTDGPSPASPPTAVPPPRPGQRSSGGDDGSGLSALLGPSGSATPMAGMQPLLPGSASVPHPHSNGAAAGCGGDPGAAAGPLSSRNTMTLIHGSAADLASGGELPTALSSGGAGGGSGRNTMTVIHGAAAAAGELDGEVVEELAQGVRAAGAGGGAGRSGLQEFATESGRRVVLVKASRGKAEGATVSAAGVGWGMGGRGAGGASSIAPKEARQLAAEMAKKQQIWKVRKTFGLEPTALADRSAQVEEVGSGAWQ